MGDVTGPDGVGKVYGDMIPSDAKKMSSLKSFSLTKSIRARLGGVPGGGTDGGGEMIADEDDDVIVCECCTSSCCVGSLVLGVVVGGVEVVGWKGGIEPGPMTLVAGGGEDVTPERLRPLATSVPFALVAFEWESPATPPGRSIELRIALSPSNASNLLSVIFACHLPFINTSTTFEPNGTASESRFPPPPPPPPLLVFLGVTGVREAEVGVAAGAGASAVTNFFDFFSSPPGVIFCC